MMNAEHIHDKVTRDEGLAAQLAASDETASKILEKLYLSTVSRYPSDQERAAAEPLFGHDPKQRRKASEDLLWALMNSPEFLLQD